MSGTRRYRLRTAASGGIFALAVLTFTVSGGAHSSPGFGTSRGPSSATDPYVLPVAVDWDQSGNRQNAEAAADGLTLNRIEDGDFDPRHPNDFWFVTTEGGKGAAVPTGSFGRDGGGLWKLSFEDVDQPWLGGTLTLVLDGSEAPFLNKPDNITIDTRGNLLIQEDPGSNVHVARIVAYDIETGDRGVVAQFDPALFKPVTPGGTDAPITIDEESSGIIDAKDVLGRGWYAFDAQVHKAHPDPALVELGQLLALYVRDFDDVYTISD